MVNCLDKSETKLHPLPLSTVVLKMVIHSGSEGENFSESGNIDLKKKKRKGIQQAGSLLFSQGRGSTIASPT
jgi:hypothetical protein